MIDEYAVPFSKTRYENFSRTLVLDMLYRALDENIITPQDLKAAHAHSLKRHIYRCVSVSPPPSAERVCAPPQRVCPPPERVCAPPERALSEHSSISRSTVSERSLSATLKPKRKSRKRYKGFVKCFGKREGYGFISCNELKEAYKQDVFLHHVQVSELGFDLTRGDLVEFTVEENVNRQPQARNLKRLRAAALA